MHGKLFSVQVLCARLEIGLSSFKQSFVSFPLSVCTLDSPGRSVSILAGRRSNVFSYLSRPYAANVFNIHCTYHEESKKIGIGTGRGTGIASFTH